MMPTDPSPSARPIFDGFSVDMAASVPAVVLAASRGDVAEAVAELSKVWTATAKAIIALEGQLSLLQIRYNADHPKRT